MYDVFISYRRKNGFAVAKMLSELLKTKGISAFVDLDELRSGTFDDKILLAIENSPAFLLILTPEALDRCGEENDWLTREILKAIECGRNIIPILCDGFSWPGPALGLPEEIKTLSNYNCVIMSNDYVDAMVDKIIEYVKGRNLPIRGISDEPMAKPQGDLDGFFNVYAKDPRAVSGADFAFHAGSVWHQDMGRIEMLSSLADAGAKIRIIVNTPEVAEQTSKYMRHKMKRYIPFEEAIRLWKDFQALYENVELRICDVPLLRIYYGLNLKNEADSAIRIKFYTHGNARIDRNYSHNFTPQDPDYELYRSEFEFLWERSEKTK